MFSSYVGLSLFVSLNLINYIFCFVGKKFEEDNCVGKMLDNQSVQIKDNWLLLIHNKLIGSKLYFLLLLHENKKTENDLGSSALKVANFFFFFPLFLIGKSSLPILLLLYIYASSFFPN